MSHAHITRWVYYKKRFMGFGKKRFQRDIQTSVFFSVFFPKILFTSNDTILKSGTLLWSFFLRYSMSLGRSLLLPRPYKLYGFKLEWERLTKKSCALSMSTYDIFCKVFFMPGGWTFAFSSFKRSASLVLRLVHDESPTNCKALKLRYAIHHCLLPH